MDALIRFNGSLSAELKEEVRSSLATSVGCVFCATVGSSDRPSGEKPDPRVALAVAYADQLREPKLIDDSTFVVLREEFTEAEIVELTCWSLFMIASQGFGAVMKIEPASDDDVARYAEWRAAGVVGQH